MRILHLVKTVDGARWALHQVQELCKKNLEMHVVLPSLQTGRFLDEWKSSPAILHEANLDLPVKSIWKFPRILRQARDLVDKIQPDLIHSHFVGPTLIMRHALGNKSVPLIFQVPGPLHLEHSLYRSLDLKSARNNDYWVASSLYTQKLYEKYGVPKKQLFCSYYGWYHQTPTYRNIGELKEKLNLPCDHHIVGNINYMYAPKYFLGQKVGIKRHELLIDALGILLKKRQDVFGLLIGSAWAGKTAYENKLRRRAQRLSGKILLPGYVSSEEYNSWQLFDLAVHTPLSENCGGVVEPLLAKVATIASCTGGLPEVVQHEKTGHIVAHNICAQNLALAMNGVLDNLSHYKKLAKVGSKWVQESFDVCTTAQQIYDIYKTILQ
ncbi:glycosyltransferase family 4 protein [Candidatus Uabimicrobium sp. HlEnr_7]|uniref:glycosyltransferase family 4 protein n=1 Tax=Candidatus Uabimicrobium helgolandensis TaxID=3095367 RepID=UPI0035581AE1